MNEQINELFEQAVKEFSAEHKYATFIVPNPLKEKFGQLIVQSCISEVAMMGVTNYENEDITWAVDVIIKNIKSRWEVES